MTIMAHVIPLVYACVPVSTANTCRGKNESFPVSLCNAEKLLRPLRDSTLQLHGGKLLLLERLVSELN